MLTTETDPWLEQARPKIALELMPRFQKSLGVLTTQDELKMQTL